jgi:uncharacterized protein (DUF2267 family)
MKFEEFIKAVMRRGGMASRSEAQEATRSTLETLSEHLTPGETENLASQLPPELGVYLNQPVISGSAERFSLPTFFHRVSMREGVDVHDADLHARAVAAVLSEAVTDGQLDHLRAQLPPDLAALFVVQYE